MGGVLDQVGREGVGGEEEEELSIEVSEPHIELSLVSDELDGCELDGCEFSSTFLITILSPFSCTILL